MRELVSNGDIVLVTSDEDDLLGNRQPHERAGVETLQRFHVLWDKDDHCSSHVAKLRARAGGIREARQEDVPRDLGVVGEANLLLGPVGPTVERAVHLRSGVDEWRLPANEAARSKWPGVWDVEHRIFSKS